MIRLTMHALRIPTICCGLTCFFLILTGSVEAVANRSGIFLEKKLATEIDGLTMTFRLSTYKRCTLGDRDAIAFDMYRTGDKFRLLLSVEPLFSDEEVHPKHAEEIRKRFVFQDKPIELHIPSYSEPTLLGVFICKDSKEEGRCAEKKAEDINEIFKSHAPGKNSSHHWHPDDKVYYFQPVLAHEDKVWILSWQDIGKNGEHFKRSINIVAGEDQVSAESIHKAITLDKTIQSEIFKSQGGAFEIRLPHYSQAKCVGKKRLKPKRY